VVLILSFVFIEKKINYINYRKGYGPYSSWVDQKQLASWINQYGTTDRLLPIANCNSSFSQSLFVSHVEVPQQVLSSGLFSSIQCDEAEIRKLAQKGPLVILSEQTQMPSQQSQLSLLSGDLHQGLWSRNLLQR